MRREIPKTEKKINSTVIFKKNNVNKGVRTLKVTDGCQWKLG